MRSKGGSGIGAGLGSARKFAGGEVNGSFEGRRFESCHVPDQEHVAQLAEQDRCREFPGEFRNNNGTCERVVDVQSSEGFGTSEGVSKPMRRLPAGNGAMSSWMAPTRS